MYRINRCSFVLTISSILFLCLLIKTNERIETLQVSAINNWYNNAQLKRGLKPHILFIVADDLGFNDVGYHGSEIKTPNIDRLAKTGVRLENYYVQPICTPTRGQLLTGKYQIYTGLHWVLSPASPSGLTLKFPTIANKLREAGYTTHMVGKWHLGFHKKEYLPTSRGFDTFFGFLSGHSNHFSHLTRNWEVKVMSGYDLMENDQPADISRYNGSYSTHLFAEKAQDIIITHGFEKPMFIYLSFQAVHSPLQVPREYLQQYAHIKDDNRRHYAAMVTCMDETIGQIEETLKKRGIWDDTLLIFTTDNGGNIGAGASNLPLKGAKGSYFEGGIRAVGFVNNEQFRSNHSNRIISELIHVTDWYPTLLNLAGGKFEKDIDLDGYDQWATLQFGAPSQRHEILHNVTPYDKVKNRTIASMRFGEWKIIVESQGMLSKASTKEINLFNIMKDPIERYDVSASHPEIVHKLIEKLKVYEQSMVKSQKSSIDLQADPKFGNGFWLPWK